LWCARAAKVTKRKGAEGKLLSAGYGFVECSSEAAARVAVKKLQVTPHFPLLRALDLICFPIPTATVLPCSHTWHNDVGLLMRGND